MKSSITVVLLFLLSSIYGQNNDYRVFLDSAKTLFYSEDNIDQEKLKQSKYYHVVSLLEKAIELNPESSEVRYFLGYAYSRLNASDGHGMIAMNLDLVYKSSEQFQKTIELTPKYSDEIVILDPYSKLSAEWGSMAMSYWHNNKIDSAIWAFGEGKRRGGFSDFILEMNRGVLDACAPNSILISSGDNFSIPLWYLQIKENYRTDVSVVDVSLLNTNWYPAFLSKTKSISFDLPDETLDTIEYIKWVDSTITIENFSWTVKPSYSDQYLLRGDRVFLSLLKQNKFQRELYFTIAFMEASRLSLKDYLTPLLNVDKLTISNDKTQSNEDYKSSIKNTLQKSQYLNLNSQDELKLFDNFRYNILGQINDYWDINEKKKAKELIILLDEFAHEDKIPFHNIEGKEYANYIRKKIKKN